jgi:hypothetical protein
VLSFSWFLPGALPGALPSALPVPHEARHADVQDRTPAFVFELEDLVLERIGENVTVDLTWAYVLLVDPTTPSVVAHRVQLESAEGRLGEVKRMAPWAETPEDWRDRTEDPGRDSAATPLPRYRLVDSIGPLVDAFPGATRTVEVELFRGGNVVVLLSPVALSVSLG